MNSSVRQSQDRDVSGSTSSLKGKSAGYDDDDEEEEEEEEINV